jgi:hypothetical protein
MPFTPPLDFLDDTWWISKEAFDAMVRDIEFWEEQEKQRSSNRIADILEKSINTPRPEALNEVQLAIS